MFDRLKDRCHRFFFAQACREIYATAPLTQSTERPVAVLSELQHKDVILFLIAIKSFARHVPLREVFVLNDGSLIRQDEEILTYHIPHVQFLPIAQFRHLSCPQGGCWERLLAIAHFNRDRYIIQLDSDTLTRAALPEVCQYVKNGTAFVLGTWDGQEIEPMRACSERVQRRHSKAQSLHVQLAAEAAFSRLAEVDELKYARGCAGFCGFPPGVTDLNFISRFSQAMEKILGSRWHEWGSEQVMSNVVVANAPKANVLPHPDYSDCVKMTETTRFVHFVGSCRFRGGRYAKEARQVISGLKALAHAA